MANNFSYGPIQKSIYFALLLGYGVLGMAPAFDTGESYFVDSVFFRLLGFGVFGKA